MKKFNTKINGYDKSEVNSFVNEVAIKYDEMLSSLKERDSQIATLKEKLVHYESMESTLNRALLVAEDASNQIKRIAREETNLILEDAKKNANRIINNALIKAEKAENDADNLRRTINSYKRKIRQALEEQLERLEDFEEIEM